MKKFKLIVIACLVGGMCFLGVGSAHAVGSGGTLFEKADSENLLSYSFGVWTDDVTSFGVYSQVTNLSMELLNKNEVDTILANYGYTYRKEQVAFEDVFSALGIGATDTFSFYFNTPSSPEYGSYSTENSFSFMKGSSLVFVDDIKTAVPIPATVFLFGTGLAGLVGLRRRKRVL
ncbi:exported hypothetical protein [Desulfamplus magnetovallimortis]|uniref:Ice-binding protein C-terminal domain-containing protein n=1 Tax=Desulfamplus magnetovallimortis TaxID=1246637 RepID=A0A1W1HDS0_9BACT|nr:VPLPA-CTERM sorting domain-containing protein [Desulfamplus magnetovallimortis]SLM30644.1 exported hypothetical protein [Desulfamplus magnetovallimortis]